MGSVYIAQPSLLIHLSLWVRSCFTSLCWVLAELAAMRWDSTQVIAVCVRWHSCAVLPPSHRGSHPSISELAALVPEAAPWAAALRQHHLLLLYSSQPFFFAEWEGYCCLIKNHSWTNEQPSFFSPLKKQSVCLHTQTYFLQSAQYMIFLPPNKASQF